MPERWLRELKRLQEMGPEEGLWRRVVEHRPRPVPGRPGRETATRVLAAIVALGMFGAVTYGAVTLVRLREGSPATSAPEVAEIVCRRDGTAVPTPEVALQPDGLHLSVENRAGRDFLIGAEPGNPQHSWGVKLSEGAGRLRPISVEPGTWAVECIDTPYRVKDMTGHALLTVTDPHGHWPAIHESVECGDPHIPAVGSDENAPLRGSLAGQILFNVFVDDSELYSLRAEDGEVVPVLTGPTDDYGAAWSPDGARIAFSRQDERGTRIDTEIFVMDADGSNVVQLTDNRADDHQPVWSPDGTSLLFVSNRDGPSSLYRMDADGSGVTRLLEGEATVESPAWSPDGSQIAFLSDRAEQERFCEDLEIFVMNADGSGLRQLTDNEAGEQHLAWSPDGRRIAYSRTNRSDYAWEIYVMDTDGTNVQRLTDHPGYDAHPAWSPDGRMIAFSSDRDMPDHRGTQGGSIYVMNADGSGVTGLFTPERGEAFVEDWR